MTFQDLEKKGFHERFTTDSYGRRWDFVERKRPPNPMAWDHPWNKGALVWVCGECGNIEPVRFQSVVHDEVIVSNPTVQLDAHDCDEARVRGVIEG